MVKDIDNSWLSACWYSAVLKFLIHENRFSPGEVNIHFSQVRYMTLIDLVLLFISFFCYVQKQDKNSIPSCPHHGNFLPFRKCLFNYHQVYHKIFSLCYLWFKQFSVSPPKNQPIFVHDFNIFSSPWSTGTKSFSQKIQKNHHCVRNKKPYLPPIVKP